VAPHRVRGARARVLLPGPPEKLAGLRMAELPALPIQSELNPGDQPVPGAERERDRSILNLDHLTVDLWKLRLNLIDEDTERRHSGRRGLGSRRPGTPQTDEDTEGDDSSRGPAHAGTDASISPEASPGGRESQGMGRKNVGSI